MNIIVTCELKRYENANLARIYFCSANELNRIGLSWMFEALSCFDIDLNIKTTYSSNKRLKEFDMVSSQRCRPFRPYAAGIMMIFFSLIASKRADKFNKNRFCFGKERASFEEKE